MIVDNGAPGQFSLGACPVDESIVSEFSLKFLIWHFQYCPTGGCKYTSSKCQAVQVAVHDPQNGDSVFVWPISDLGQVPPLRWSVTLTLVSRWHMSYTDMLQEVANAFISDNSAANLALDGNDQVNLFIQCKKFLSHLTEFFQARDQLLHSTKACSQLTYNGYRLQGVTYTFSQYVADPDPDFFSPSYPATSPYITAWVHVKVTW